MKVLLTGATGYIGKRLLPHLIEEGHDIICCVRDKRRFQIDEYPQEHIQVVEIDFLKDQHLPHALRDIDVAFYLIHSMVSTTKNFDDLEATTAHHFKMMMEETTVKQVIYLGGIINADHLSQHLQSRKSVEDILQSDQYATTVLRAGIIVGSGSASFEIIRDIVEKLPVMVAPKWLKTPCQPIAIRNVLQYLMGVMLRPDTYRQSFDIGGPEVLTYKEMLLQFAEVRHMKRYIISVPVLSPRLSSYWLYFVTSTSYNLAVNLVDSMKVPVVCHDQRLKELLQIQSIPYKEAVELAFKKIEQNSILSSWKDSLSSSSEDVNLLNYAEIPQYGCFSDKKRREIQEEDLTRIIENIWAIGGDRGWYYGNFLWQIRGFMDKLAGGIGLRRGRTTPNHISAGDALDFWRVLIADKSKGRLLLYAEMKLPGEAWLEFKVKRKEGKIFLLQNATFRPYGVWGRLYWYAVLPFHYFIFNGMIDNLINYQADETKESPLVVEKTP